MLVVDAAFLPWAKFARGEIPQMAIEGATDAPLKEAKHLINTEEKKLAQAECDLEDYRHTLYLTSNSSI